MLERFEGTKAKERLAYIQQVLKAPKNRSNVNVKYKFRNLDGIIQAVKPFLEETGMILVFGDSLQEAGGNVYITATASVECIDIDSVYQCCAHAKEEQNFKMQSNPQMTGTASSYARKYAANGLFCIDDSDLEEVKDADEMHGATIGAKEIKELNTRIRATKTDVAMMIKTIDNNFGTNITSIEEMSVEQYNWIMVVFDKAIKEKKKKEE